jgi:hypothetical protein
MAYLFRRHYSELRFYTSPTEGLRILTTPAASLSIIQKSIGVIDQLSAPTERYKKGKRKGELKLHRKVGQLVPIYSQMDRYIEDTYKWVTKD